MDVATISGLVSTLGFPIVLVGVFCWFGYKVWKRQVEINEKREDKLLKAVNDTNELNRELSNTNEKVTTINEKLVEHLTKDVSKLKDDVCEIKTILIKK